MMHTAQKIFSFSLVSILLIAAGGCGHDKASTIEAQLTPLEAHVAIAELVHQGEQIEVQGTVQPARQSFLSSRVMGPVVEVNVQAGEKVRAGQALVEIQPETSKGQVAQAKGALAQATAALTMAERNFQRFEALHQQEAASGVELDFARMQYEQAKGAVTQAEGAVQAASSVAGEAIVRAPFSARVVDKLVEVGDLAAPGRPLIRLESVDGRSIWLSVRESDIKRLSLDQRLPVTIDSRPDLGTIEAVVDEIVPSADPATHTFTVKIGLPAVKIASGISGRALMPGDGRDVIAIPASAVHYRGGLELVIVKADDNSARTRAVTTATKLSDGRIEILSGIKAGDVVVIDAPTPVADGTAIEVLP